MQGVNIPSFLNSRISRRGFLATSATVAAASGLSKTSWLSAAEPTAVKVIVGGHPWVTGDGWSQVMPVLLLARA